ncbi:MAG: T9SS type A sorting domain-containing protein [Ignavibacteria bacterium]|nr:T9SS type A sorting domain-containing protein [Ignavibacteria bacterium]
MKTIIFLSAVFAFLIISQNESISQWSGDPDNPMVVCNELRDQTEPVMINDGSGGFFVFWADQRNYTQNESDLYGQRLDAGGNKLWASAGKLIADSVLYSIPKVIKTSDGNVIVLYSSAKGVNKIYAAKINLSGNNVWSGPLAFYVAGWPQLGADIYNAVSDGSGGIIVTYQVTWGGGTTVIFAQRITSNGIIKWSPSTNGYNLSVSGESRAPVITSDERGGAHIFWYNVPGPYNIWKTHIDSSGNFPPKEALYLTQNNYPLIRAVSDGTGGAVISWATNGGGATASDIFAQRINFAGDEQWNATGNIVCNFNGAQTSHNLIRTSDGDYIIVWTDGRRINVNNDVYCQKLNASGNSLWTSNGVLVTNYPAYYPEPNLINDNSGGAYIFVYNSQSFFSVARIKSDSTFAWTPNLKTIASGNFYPSYHRFQPAKNGDGVAVVWQTFNNIGGIGLGIFGANINVNGTLNIEQVSTEIPSGFSLIQNYPNPFNPNTVIGFSIRTSSFTSLEIFDITGKEVSTLVNENLQPGTYEVDFNGSNITGGVYFYRLTTEDFSETKKMILIK